MDFTLYQYSLISCIVATLVLAFAMMFIGNRKARTLQWLLWAKWAISIVLLLEGCVALVQYVFHLSDNYPNVNTAVNVTMLFAASLILIVAFFPIAYNVADMWKRIRLSLSVFIVSCALTWASAGLSSPLDGILLVCAIALFLFELSRITIVFNAKFKQLTSMAVKQQQTSEESAYLSYLHFLARGVLLLALYAALFAVLALWSQNTMAIFNFASLLLWIYIFVAIVNVIINYNPNEDPESLQMVVTEANANPIAHLESKLATLKQEDARFELNQLVINLLEKKINAMVEEKFYCTHGITMDSMAQQLNTNRSYLSRYINLTYGCSFNTWLTRLRIDLAAQLLIDSPTLSLDKIAHMGGFASRSHFMSSFKATKGDTPGRWRELNTPSPK